MFNKSLFIYCLSFSIYSSLTCAASNEKTIASYQNEQKTCETKTWQHTASGKLFPPQIGLLEFPSWGIYGDFIEENGASLPSCELLKLPKKIILPVLLIDFEDYEPSNEGIENYIKSSKEHFSERLNGTSGPRQYFKDVSGGVLDIEFEVIGWLDSGTENSYLKERSQYLVYNEANPKPYCENTEIVKDAIRDAIQFYNTDFRRFDSEYEQDTGIVDGLVIVVEGQDEICNKPRMETMSFPNFSPASDITKRTNGRTFNSPLISGLIPENDNIYHKFSHQNLLFSRFIQVPETYIESVDFELWNHELGHLLLGYPDYYYPKNEMQGFALSTQNGSHPAAWEKWLYGHWITPELITSNGSYTLDANEIDDGKDYSSGKFLYLFQPDEDVNHYITIEFRNFENKASSKWANPTTKQAMQTGVLITEFNWNVGLDQNPSQIKKLSPIREIYTVPYTSFIEGDTFNKCFATKCISLSNFKITDIAIFDVEILSKSNEGVVSFTADEIELGTEQFDIYIPVERTGTGKGFTSVKYQFLKDDIGLAWSPNSYGQYLAWEDGETGVKELRFGLGNAHDIEGSSESFAIQLSNVEGEVNLENNNLIINISAIDSDGDGVPDLVDTFPYDPTEQYDTDNDGIGNNADTDDDDDGVNDDSDSFPLDRSESIDTDNDGIGNNADTDDDGDGVNDDSDAFPLDPDESIDTDNDGIGNNADTDDDGDGVSDSSDDYPFDSSRSANEKPTIDNSKSSSGGSMPIYWLLQLSAIRVFFKFRIVKK